MGVVDSRELPWNQPPGHFSGFSKYLVNPEFEKSKYFDFRISRYPIKGLVEEHVHDVAEQIFYFISGEALVTFGKEKKVVTKGFTMFVPPGISHAVENTGDEDLVFVVVTSPPDDIPRS
jgi:mannose-6-phosphate isomerase-like protein (cupin superfamily)